MKKIIAWYIYVCVYIVKGRSRTDARSPPPYNSLLSLQKQKAYAKGHQKNSQTHGEQPPHLSWIHHWQVYSMNFKTFNARFTSSCFFLLFSCTSSSWVSALADFLELFFFLFSLSCHEITNKKN